MNILAQNPIFHATPTSGILGTILNFRDNWKQNEVYKACGEDYIYPRIGTTMKGMLEGYYEKELYNGLIPIDKNRGWAHQIELLEELFNCNIKIIFPIRHVADCLASLEKARRKSLFVGNENKPGDQTTPGRAENMLKDDGVIGVHIAGLREIINRGLTDRLAVVNYDSLISNPKATISQLYAKLGLGEFEHDFENVKQSTVESDLFHGYAPKSLHTIKEGRIQLKEKESVYHAQYIDMITNKRYRDITNFINEHK